MDQSFPLKIARTPAGSWHWVKLCHDWREPTKRLAERITCNTHTTPMDYPDEHSYWSVIADYESLEMTVGGLEIPKKGRGGSIIVTKEGCSFPRINHGPGQPRGFCMMCLRDLYHYYNRLKREVVMKSTVLCYEFELRSIDEEKPLIIFSDGKVAQAENKTLSAAKKMARDFIEKSDCALSATIYKPHTKLARQVLPVKETRLS
jgi:hypothetical protein